MTNEEKELRATYRKGLISRFNRLKIACGSIRTLSGVYILIGEDVHIDLKDLIASWDIDLRPEIRDSKVRFFNTKTNGFKLENGEVFSYSALNNENLKKLYDYFKILIP